MSDDPRSPTALRERAAKCRRFATAVTNRRAAEQLRVFADDLEAQAHRLEANLQAGHTHATVTRLLLGELRHTSAQAKEAVRRARTARKRPKGAGAKA